ncbi:hypothetical protein COT94_01680, partial [Candidatus Falkowbacteria bacterium CG10_big_fil_rev_8_21_14_0_10_37_14]
QLSSCFRFIVGLDKRFYEYFWVDRKMSKVGVRKVNKIISVFLKKLACKKAWNKVSYSCY